MRRLSDDDLRFYRRLASETPRGAEHGDDVRNAQLALQRDAMTPAQLAAEEAQYQADRARDRELAEARAWEQQQREDDLLERYRNRG